MAAIRAIQEPFLAVYFNSPKIKKIKNSMV
jgi:hypothetical protein